MEFIRLFPNLLVNADSITTLRKEVEEGRAVFYVGLADGREVRIENPQTIIDLDSTIVVGETDDPLTTELPRSFFQSVLARFRR